PRARASRRDEAGPDRAARASQGRRLPGGLVGELPIGARGLPHPRARGGGLGQSAAAADVLPGDPLVASPGGVRRIMSKARWTTTALAVLLCSMWVLADQQPPAAGAHAGAPQGRGQGG